MEIFTMQQIFKYDLGINTSFQDFQGKLKNILTFHAIKIRLVF